MVALALWLGSLQLIALAAFGSAWLVDAGLRRRSAATRRGVWALAIVMALVLPLMRLAIEAPAISLRSELAGAMLVIWLVGFVALLVRLLLGLHVVRRWVAASVEIESPAWRADSSALRGDRAEVELRRCAEITGPVCVGLVRSRILVPDAMLELPADERRSLLAHELAHVARGDASMLILGGVARAIYWINPLAWLALRRFRAQAENAADDAVLSVGVTSSSYAAQLVALARAQVMIASSLRERVLAILDVERSRSVALTMLPRWGAARLVGVAVLLASLATACEARSEAPVDADSRVSSPAQARALMIK